LGRTADREQPVAKVPLWRKAFGRSFLGFAAVAAGAGVAVYLLAGPEALRGSLQDDLGTFLQILPNFLGAMLLAVFIPSLLPPNFMERLIGEGSGARGMLVGSVAGAATPGGPMTSFPLVLVLRSAGAGRAPLISYLTAWSTLGIHRILVWEIQLLGLEFALVRALASAPLGIIAGLLSRFVPPTATGPDVTDAEPAGKS